MTQRTRRLPFEGAVNFRDLGGYAVGGGRVTRWGRVYRSDSLASLTDADLERLAALELHALIDFRLPHERHLHPNRLPAGATLRAVELGFWPQGVAELHRAFQARKLDVAGMVRLTREFYRYFPVNHAAEYRTLLETIEAAGPDPLPRYTSDSVLQLPRRASAERDRAMIRRAALRVFAAMQECDALPLVERRPHVLMRLDEIERELLAEG